MRLRAITPVLVIVANGVCGLIMHLTIFYLINADVGYLQDKTGFIYFSTGLVVVILDLSCVPRLQ